MQKTIQKQSGFTLIELMVIIIIIGILAAIVYPNYIKYVQNARLQNAKADLMLAQNMLEKYYSQNHSFRDKNDSSAYPNAVLSQINNEFFNIAFYTGDEASSNLLCSPDNLDPAHYCLYAAPKSNNENETRFVFIDAAGFMQKCEKNAANISAAGVLTNKEEADCIAF